MFITIYEIIDIIIMTLVLGYIFKDIFRIPYYHPSYESNKKYSKRISFENSNFLNSSFMLSVIVVAPAIIFHEMAHKFTAIAFGLDATFHSSYPGLLIGLILKLINFPFIFFIPGYVQIVGGNLLQNSIIAFAGPFMNLLLSLASYLIIKKSRNLSIKQYFALNLTKQINMFLFIFNMIPFPPFDGYTFISGILRTFIKI